MKILLAIQFALITTFNLSYSQIPKVKLSDSTIIKVIDYYIEKRKIPKNEAGIFLIEIRFNNSLIEPILFTESYKQIDQSIIETNVYTVGITFTYLVDGVNINPPDSYTVYKNRLALFYTGMNFIVSRSKKEKEELIKIFKKLSNNMVKNHSNHDFMKFKVSSKEFTPLPGTD